MEHRDRNFIVQDVLISVFRIVPEETIGNRSEFKKAIAVDFKISELLPMIIENAIRFCPGPTQDRSPFIWAQFVLTGYSSKMI